MARLGRTTVRTLQWYDRIGLLTADRDRQGRRRYGERHLGRLQQIQLLVASGLTLDEVAQVMEARRRLSLSETYAAQVRLLEVQELRLRCTRTVLGALASVLERHPTARVPSRVLVAVMDLDATLLQFPQVEVGAAPPQELGEEAIGRVLAVYFAWKAAAVQALLLIDNDIPSDSVSGRELGRAYREAIGRALGDDEYLTNLHLATEADHAAWPEADRELHLTTKEFLDQCETAALEHEASAYSPL